ncbi:hypothetical protein HAX54_040527, partial [Datura stramonium]|nr:hypothetical protein [Datura stramonium]
ALNEVEEMKRIFSFYKFEWMARTLKKYNAETVWEFYAKHLATMEQKAKYGKKLKEQLMCCGFTAHLTLKTKKIAWN